MLNLLFFAALAAYLAATLLQFAAAFARGVALMYIVLKLQMRAEWIGDVAMPCAFLVLSYAAFAIAGCVGVVYLIRERKGEEAAKLLQMDYLSYRLIAFGFLMLTVVILSGCVWAEQAWSSFWSWDLKETWALITWIFYAIYLHQRLRKNWQGKRMAWYAIILLQLLNALLPAGYAGEDPGGHAVFRAPYAAVSSGHDRAAFRAVPGGETNPRKGGYLPCCGRWTAGSS